MDGKYVYRHMNVRNRSEPTNVRPAISPAPRTVPCTLFLQFLLAVASSRFGTEVELRDRAALGQRAPKRASNLNTHTEGQTAGRDPRAAAIQWPFHVLIQ